MELAWTRMFRPPVSRTCAFLFMAIASRPASVRRAIWKLPKPGPGLTRRFTRRWSCSTMLLRNLHCRRREKRHSSPFPFNCSMADGQAGFLSTVMVRGLTVCGCPSALRKKRFAAAASRLAESRKSIVWPRLSTTSGRNQRYCHRRTIGKVNAEVRPFHSRQGSRFLGGTLFPSSGCLHPGGFLRSRLWMVRNGANRRPPS